MIQFNLWPRRKGVHASQKGISQEINVIYIYIAHFIR